MKISIITVNYNGAKTLKQTIESILNQTYDNVEYIIIDGKSKDDSLEIIKAYESKFKKRGYIYRYISEKDSGIYNAMNKGLNLVTGDIIGILNSDDWYENITLENVANEFKKYQDLQMVYGILRKIKNEKYFELKGNYYSFGVGLHPAVFLRKEIYDKYGNFNEKYRIAADTDFLLRLKRNNINYKFIEKIFTNFRIGGVSTTNELKMNLEHLDVCYRNNEISKNRKMILVFRSYLKFLVKKILNEKE